jgi:hypothetical protein
MRIQIHGYNGHSTLWSEKKGTSEAKINRQFSKSLVLAMHASL